MYVLDQDDSKFPGSFQRPPRIETNVTYHIQSNASEWHSTGTFLCCYSD